MEDDNSSDSGSYDSEDDWTIPTDDEADLDILHNIIYGEPAPRDTIHDETSPVTEQSVSAAAAEDAEVNTKRCDSTKAEELIRTSQIMDRLREHFRPLNNFDDSPFFYKKILRDAPNPGCTFEVLGRSDCHRLW